MKMDQFKLFQINIARKLKTKREFLRIFLAEFLGTAILVALGDGAVAQMVLSHDAKISTFMTVNFAFAFAVTFGLYISGGVSGGHINPAVTLCMCVFGKCSWSKLPAYWSGQFIGAFLGSTVVFTTYYDAFVTFDVAMRAIPINEPIQNSTYWVFNSAGIFGTYPRDHLSVFGGFYDQFIGTLILLLCIFAITDPQNMNVPKYLVPLLIGLVVGVISMSYGWNFGFAINPARDFAPRLFTLIAGWGPKTFQFKNYSFFLAPIIGPFLGAIVGGSIYQLFIGLHWPTIVKYEAHVSDELSLEKIYPFIATKTDDGAFTALVN